MARVIVPLFTAVKVETEVATRYNRSRIVIQMG